MVICKQHSYEPCRFSNGKHQSPSRPGQGVQPVDKGQHQQLVDSTAGQQCILLAECSSVPQHTRLYGVGAEDWSLEGQAN